MDPTVVTILAVVAVYFALSLGVGFWVARGERNIADDYFLAGRKLPWYAVSLSMTGSNIGTEHFIGMVGLAWAFGLAPATFEWGNFIPYSILIWIFLPFFFRKKLYTIPEFLERRYNSSTRTAFAFLTLLHMVIGVLVPALYAGGRILYEMGFNTTLDEFNWGFMGCILLISAVTAAYCIYGGLLSVVWTDVLQVIILLLGGVLLVWVGSKAVGGIDEVIEKNVDYVVRQLPDDTVEVKAAQDVKGTAEEDAYFSRTSLLLPADHPVSPWTGVVTFWFTLSLWYVGTNQFYIQRCLGARSEWDAKMGVIGCAFLKIFLPFIIVFPGMVAFVAFFNVDPQPARDAIYVKMIKEFFSPEGMLGMLGPLAQGLLLSALIAAIMSTVSSVLNSSSTIWSIDVHQRLIDSSSSEAGLVRVGRWATFFTIIIGTALAPLLLFWGEGIFIFIQNIAALLAPPIVVIFLAAFFWRRAHGRAATFTLWFGIVAGALLWAATSVLWMRPSVDLQDPIVAGRLAKTEDPVLKRHFAEDSFVQKHRTAVLGQLGADAAVRQRIADRPAVRAALAVDDVYQRRLTNILQGLAKDPVIRQQIGRDRVFRAEMVKDPEVKKLLAEDTVAQEQIVKNPVFQEHLAAEPLVGERLFKDSAVRKHLAGDPLLGQRLAKDPLVRNRLAQNRLIGWLPLLDEETSGHVVVVIGCMKPLLNRAAITWVLCLIVMVLTTCWMRQDPHECYDPDAIWNPHWARLPADEQQLNTGRRNLMFWWIVMVAASTSLFVIFR